jgi:hypothetical protein
LFDAPTAFLTSRHGITAWGLVRLSHGRTGSKSHTTRNREFLSQSLILPGNASIAAPKDYRYISVWNHWSRGRERRGERFNLKQNIHTGLRHLEINWKSF